jgi:hypothetical protein
MTKLMNRLLRTISMLEYFINRSWEWSTANTEMLMSELSPEDQRVSMENWPNLRDNLTLEPRITWPVKLMKEVLVIQRDFDVFAKKIRQCYEQSQETNFMSVRDLISWTMLDFLCCFAVMFHLLSSILSSPLSSYLLCKPSLSTSEYSFPIYLDFKEK